MKSLFQRIKEAGIRYSNHESDLYVPDIPEVREILKDFPEKVGVLCVPFYHQEERRQWLDLPFAYDVWWESKGCSV